MAHNVQPAGHLRPATSRQVTRRANRKVTILELAMTLSVPGSTILIQQHLTVLNANMQADNRFGFVSRQSCLSIQNETEVVPTASRLRIFYSSSYVPVKAATNQDIGTQSYITYDLYSDVGGFDPLVHLSFSRFWTVLTTGTLLCRSFCCFNGLHIELCH